MIRPSASEVAAALRVAVRLLACDAGAWRAFDDNPETFWKSFWAALPVLPVYAVTLALHLDVLAEQGLSVRAGWLELLLLESAAYVISWTAFPLVLFHLTRLLDKPDRFVPLVASLNWLNVPLALLGTAVVLIAEAGLFGALSGLLRFGAQIYVLVCLTHLVMKVLELRAFAAFGVVLVGLVIDYFLLSATTSALM